MHRPKVKPKEAGDSPGADEGPPPPCRSWQAPPDGLFDVIVPQLTAKQFVVVQLVCKDWSCSARYCLKNAAPKRPDLDLRKLVTLYPNLTQLNLSHLEGWTTRMLTPLRQLTALRELCMSNITLHQDNATQDDGANDPPGRAAPSAAGPDAVEAVAGPGRARSGRVSGAQSPLSPRKRSRARSAAGGPLTSGGGKARNPASPRRLPPLPGRSPPGQKAAHGAVKNGLGSLAAGAASGAGAGAAALVEQGQQQEGTPQKAGNSAAPDEQPDAGAAGPSAAGEGHGSGAAPAAAASPLPPPSPASRIFGSLGDVLLRLTKLQADLCPALTAESIAALPALTDLTLDTLITPAALAPLARLRSLAVKKLANPEHLDRLSRLTSLLVNSDSSCSSEFLPVCTRLPELRSLTFKTSSTKVLQNADALSWQGFSRLSSLDLRVPVELVKPGLPALADLGGLGSLSLDLYCASEEELMVTVVAPPNLTSLFVSSDRSRSGGVIDVHPNARLRSMRLRLYWTALNLILPEGLPEPSPLPEPLSEDLMDAEETGPGPSPGLLRRLEAELAGEDAGARKAAGTGPAEPGPGACGAGAGTPGTGGRGRRKRVSEASPGPVVQEDAAGAAAGSPGRGQRRRVSRGKAAAGASSGDATLGGCADGEEDAGQEVEFPGAAGAGPSRPVTCAAVAASPAAAAVGGDTAVADDAADEMADADSGKDVRLASPAPGGAAAAAPGPHSGQRSRRTPSRLAAGIPPSPLSPLRCGGAGRGSQRRGSDVATPAASAGGAAGTPHASNAGGGTPRAGSGGGGAAGGGTSPLPDLALEELCLDACFFLLYGSLVPLLRQYPRLRSLTLDNSLALENGELAQLCELTRLQELSLSAMHLLTDGGLRALGRLTDLTSLRLRGLRKMSIHAAQSYMRQKPIVRRHEDVSGSFLTSLSPLSGLRCLTLKHMHTAKEGQLVAGLRGLTQLTRLEVKDVRSMSDTVLAGLNRHTRLRELNVLHCEGVTARGRNAVVRCLGQRLALDFEGCSLPDITRPCALPTASTQAQLIDDDQTSSSNHPRPSCQHSNQQ